MPEYRLDDLSFQEFERLCQRLLRAKFGITIESWGGSGDWGVDAYCPGPLKFSGDDLRDGPFIFQAKFVSGANAAGAKPKGAILKAVSAECVRICKRALPDPKVYVLLTNVPIAPDWRTEAEKKLRKVLPGCELISVQGGEDVCDLLSSHPDVMQSFPKLLSFRALGVSGYRPSFANGIERHVYNIIYENIQRRDVLEDVAVLLQEVCVAREACGDYIYEITLNLLGMEDVVIGGPRLGKLEEVIGRIWSCVDSQRVSELVDLVIPFCWVDQTVANRLRELISFSGHRRSAIWLRRWEKTESMCVRRALCTTDYEIRSVHDQSGEAEVTVEHVRSCICSYFCLGRGATDDEINKMLNNCWIKKTPLIISICAETLDPDLVATLEKRWPNLAFILYVSASGLYDDDSLGAASWWVDQIVDLARIERLHIDLDNESLASFYYERRLRPTGRI